MKKRRDVETGGEAARSFGFHRVRMEETRGTGGLPHTAYRAPCAALLRLCASAFKLPVRRRAGMTMIELVSALALMAIVTATVLALLNKASVFWSGEAHNEMQDGEVDRFFRQWDDDLRQAVADTAGDVSSNVTFCIDVPKRDIGAGERNYFLCFVRPSSPRGFEQAENGENKWRLSLDCVKYAANADGEIIREVYPLYSDELVGKQVKEIWEDASEPSPDRASSRVALTCTRVEDFSASALVTNTVPLVTNALPVSVTIQLRAFKDEAERNEYRRLLDETSEDARLRRESLGVPYLHLVPFPAYGSEEVL